MLTLAQLKLTKVKRTPALANPCTQHFVIYISCVTNHGSIFCFSSSPNLPSVRLFKTVSAFRMEARIHFLCMQQGDYEFHRCDAPALQNISHTYTCQKSGKKKWGQQSQMRRPDHAPSFPLFNHTRDPKQPRAVSWPNLPMMPCCSQGIANAH